MITVNGRPKRNWDCATRHFEGQILIRLDDRDDPTFWLEIVCDECEVEGLLVNLLMWLDNTAVMPKSHMIV